MQLNGVSNVGLTILGVWHLDNLLANGFNVIGGEWVAGQIVNSTKSGPTKKGHLGSTRRERHIRLFEHFILERKVLKTVNKYIAQLIMPLTLYFEEVNII